VVEVKLIVLCAREGGEAGTRSEVGAMARRVEERYRGSKGNANVDGFGLRLRVEFGNAFLFSAVFFTDEVAARNSSDVGNKLACTYALSGLSASRTRLHSVCP